MLQGVQNLGAWLTAAKPDPFPQSTALEQALSQFLPAPRDAFFAHSGIPASADACAYDPVLGILAVSTPDGIVKLLSSNGEQVTLASLAAERTATRQLAWLEGRCALMRLAQGGDVEVWAFSGAPNTTAANTTAALPSRLPVGRLHTGDEDGRLTAFAHLPGSQHVVAGTAGGGLCVLQLLQSAGGAPHVRLVEGLALGVHSVPASALAGHGEVLSLALQPFYHGEVTLALLLHQSNGVVVWDLRAQQLVAALQPEAPLANEALRSASTITSTCWLGGRTADLATGHISGAVLLWGLVDVVPGLGVQGTQQPGVLLLAVVGLAPAPACGVQGLSHMWFQERKRGALVVHGGGHAEMPPGLALLPLGVDESGAVVAGEAARLPWLGGVEGWAHASSHGSGTSSDQLLVLFEGGKLLQYDVASRDTTLPVLPFHAQPHTTASAMCTLPRHSSGSNSGSNSTTATSSSSSISMQDLQAAAVQQSLKAKRSASTGASGSGSSSPKAHEAATPSTLNWSNPKRSAAQSSPSSAVIGGEAGFSGRTLYPTDSVVTLLLTGHTDGCVRLWGLESETPRLLGQLPPRRAHPLLADAVEGLAAVTAVQFCWQAGVAVVGHAGGAVRLYLMAHTSQATHVTHMRSDPSSPDTVTATTVAVEQHAGWQVSLCLDGVHQQADITALTYTVLPRSYSSPNSSVQTPSRAASPLPPAAAAAAAAAQQSQQQHLLAVGDAAGAVSLTDVTRRQLLWYQEPCSAPVVSLAVANCPLPHERQRAPEVQAQLDGEEAAAQGAAAEADASTGAQSRQQYARVRQALAARASSMQRAPSSRDSTTSSHAGSAADAPDASAAAAALVAPRLLCVVVAARDGSVGVLEAQLGVFVGKWGLAAPNWGLMGGSKALCAELLDGQGRPLWMRQQEPSTTAGLQGTTSDAATAAATATATASSPADVAIHALLATDTGLSLHSMQGLAAGSLRASKSCRAGGKVLAAHCCEAEGAPAVAVLERGEDGVCAVLYSLPGLSVMSTLPLRRFPGTWGAHWPPDPSATDSTIAQPWSTPTPATATAAASGAAAAAAAADRPTASSPVPAAAAAAAAVQPVDDAFIWQSAASACTRQGQLLLLGRASDGAARLALLRLPQLLPAWRAAGLGASWARSDAALADAAKSWPPLHDRRVQLRRAEQMQSAGSAGSSQGSAKTDLGLPNSSSWPGKAHGGRVRAKVAALKHRVADALSDAANEVHLNELRLAASYPYPPLAEVLASPASPVEPGSVTGDVQGGDAAVRVLGAMVGLVVGHEGGERLVAALAPGQGLGSSADAEGSLSVERSSRGLG